MTEKDSIRWLEMMIEHSPLNDCKPMFRQIALELTRLRKARKMLAEFTRSDGKKVTVNSMAVAWVAPHPDGKSTSISISGGEGNSIVVQDAYADVVSSLLEAME